MGITIGRFYVAVAGTVLYGSGWVLSNAAFESYFFIESSCIGNLFIQSQYLI